MDVTVDVLTLLGQSSAKATTPLTQLRILVERGMPFASVDRIAKHLSAETIRSFILDTDKDAKSLSRGDSERIARLAYVLALSHHVWGSWEKATRFLTRPHAGLLNRPPLDLATNEWELREVEGVLRSIQFGLPA